MSSIASTYNTKIDTASSVTFSSGFIPGLSSEPKVVAKAFGLEVGQNSEPIEGINGVYVLKILNKPTDTTQPDLATLKKSVSGGIRASISSTLSEQLKKDAKIKDNRFKFY
jgi:hypothetical protein